MAIVFIPLVNIDGFEFISEEFDSTGHLEYIRKNRQIYDKMKYCEYEF